MKIFYNFKQYNLRETYAVRDSKDLNMKRNTMEIDVGHTIAYIEATTPPPCGTPMALISIPRYTYVYIQEYIESLQKYLHTLHNNIDITLQVYFS